MNKLIILIGLFVIIRSNSASGFHNVHCHAVSSTSQYICEPEEIGKFEIPLMHFNDNQTTGLKIQARKKIPTALLIRDPDNFRKFSSLISLHISSSNWTFDPNYVISVEKWHKIRSDLFDKEGLLDLRVSNAKFNSRRHSWKLPRSLETLNFSHNEYTVYDLRRCEKLLRLDFQDNRLTRMPILNDSATSMEKLNLLGNPLYEFTVSSIASLCRLEELKFNYYSMGSPRRSCECKRLKEWIRNLEIWNYGKFTFEGTFKCAEVSAEICKEFTLNDAMQRRDRCLAIGNSNKILILLMKALVVVVLMVGVIISALFLFARNRSSQLRHTKRTNDSSDIPPNQ